jgi:nitroreductase
VATEAKALLGGAFRDTWAAMRQSGQYARIATFDESTAAGRAGKAMQQFVDRFEQIPVVVLPCLVRYRPPDPTEGASIYPACQNLLLAARARGLGGVITMWHGRVEADLRALLEIPDDPHRPSRGTPRSRPPPAARRGRVRGQMGANRSLGRRPARHPLH